MLCVGVRMVGRFRTIVGRARGAVHRRGLRGIEVLSAIARLLLVMLLLLLVVSIVLVVPVLLLIIPVLLLIIPMLLLVVPVLSVLLLTLLTVCVASGVDVVRVRHVSVSRSVGIALLSIPLLSRCEVCSRAVLIVAVPKFGCRGVVMRVRVMRVLMRTVGLRVGGHSAVVRYSADVVIARNDTLSVARVKVTRAGKCAAGTFAATRTDRDLVVVVEGDVGQGRLGKGLLRELTLLVLQVRVVSCSFLACERGGTGETLLVAATDDLGDALVDLVATVLLQGMSEDRYV